jgi:hypothetical protein
MRRSPIFLLALFAVTLSSGCVLRVRATPARVALPARVSIPARVVVPAPSVYLGSDSIHARRSDRDQTIVGARRGRFSAIRVQVDNAPVDIKQLHVVLDNGEVFNVPVKTHFKRGERSHWIDLPGRKRYIQRIVVVAKSTDRRRLRRPRIKYYGRG